jgi:hypothetical protein
MLLQLAVGPVALFIFQTALVSGFITAGTGVIGAGDTVFSRINCFSRHYHRKVSFRCGDSGDECRSGLTTDLLWDQNVCSQKRLVKNVESQFLSAPSEAWQFLPVRVRIRQRVATSLTPIPHSEG